MRPLYFPTRLKLFAWLALLFFQRKLSNVRIGEMSQISGCSQTFNSNEGLWIPGDSTFISDPKPPCWLSSEVLMSN